MLDRFNVSDFDSALTATILKVRNIHAYMIQVLLTMTSSS
jgi:hypothetical protein